MGRGAERSGAGMSEPVFFASLKAWRAWLAKNHAREKEVLVGIYKKGVGKAGITHKEMVDGALAYGWIDGHVRSLGPEAYQIRVTPRRKGSIWSAINIKRVAELAEAGQMAPPGLAAFEGRDPARAKRYSFEQDQESVRFSAEQVKALRASPEAHAFFREQPAGYRRVATWWVISARQEATRGKRMQQLIEHSAARKRLPQFVSPVAAHKRKEAAE
jgi:uncharacterized protein YdeI (YjbR/CyaY-like superfamily)